MKFQIVRNTATETYQARFVNGEVVWRTESYADKQDAYAAVLALPGCTGPLGPPGETSFAFSGIRTVPVEKVAEEES